MESLLVLDTISPEGIYSQSNHYKSMNRRQFLAGTIPTASVFLGGCLGGNPSCTGEDSWPPDVQVEELELTPGDSDTFEIQVNGVTGFRSTNDYIHAAPLMRQLDLEISTYHQR